MKFRTYGYSMGSIKIKFNSGLIKNISHEIDLYSEFPWYENFTFNTEFCGGDALEDDQRANYDDQLTNEDDKWVVDVFHKNVTERL